MVIPSTQALIFCKNFTYFTSPLSRSDW